MAKVVPFPSELFADGRRHPVLLAHHDDELPYAGLIARMGPNVRVVWLTNSDGLAHEDGMAPEAYAQARWEESVTALAHLGVGEEKLLSFWHSEYELYDLFAKMGAGELNGQVPKRFFEMADQVEADARAFEPDVVWTLAYQGGHPEHDLMHLYAARFVRRYREETGKELPFYELPAYELIVVPLRFKPWRRAPFHEIWLSEDEREAKGKMLESYPTQARIIGDFRKIVTLYGKLSWLRLRPFTFAEYGNRETFAPVPDDRDYGRSTHLSPKLDYMFDDYQKRPIRFDKAIAPIARALGLGRG